MEMEILNCDPCWEFGSKIAYQADLRKIPKGYLQGCTEGGLLGSGLVGM